MRRKRRKVQSVPQRKLMGYAYACATGRREDCPPAVMDVARSFTRKDREGGLRSLRRMASTKHAGLSPTRVSESLILKFKEFGMRESVGGPDKGFYYLDYIYGLRDYEINEYINDFITSGDPEEKREYIWCIDRRVEELKSSGMPFDEAKLAMMRMALEEMVQETIRKKTH